MATWQRRDGKDHKAGTHTCSHLLSHIFQGACVKTVETATESVSGANAPPCFKIKCSSVSLSVSWGKSK